MKYSLKKGFTLLEILIAITILSLVAIIIIGAMRLGIRSVQKGEKKAKIIQDIRSLYLNIERQLSSTVYSSRLINGKRSVWFEGDSNKITFLTTASLWKKKDSFVEVTYFVKDTDEGLQLLEKEKLPGEEKGVNLVIFQGIDELGFAYLSKNEGWTKEWKEKNSYPLIVGLYLKVGNITKKMFFPIYIHKHKQGNNEKDIFEEFKKVFQ